MDRTLQNFIEFFGNADKCFVKGAYSTELEDFDLTQMEEDIPGTHGLAWGLPFNIDFNAYGNGVPNYIELLLEREIDIVEHFAGAIIINLL